MGLGHNPGTPRTSSLAVRLTHKPRFRSPSCLPFILSLLLFFSPKALASDFDSAVAAWQRGDLQAAEADLQAVLKTHPNHLLAVGDTAGAGKAFAQVVGLDSKHANANLQLARMALGRKAPSEALSYLSHLPTEELSSPAIALLRLQALYLDKQDRAADELLGTFETAEAEKDPRLQFSAGLALAAVERYAQAEQFFGRVLEAVPANFDVLYNLGLAASRAKDYARARDALTAALAQRPEDTDVLYGLAVVEVGLNQKVNAVELLAKAARVAPERADIQLLLARTTTDLGFFKDSLQAWNRYVSLIPSDDSARRDRGYVAAVLGDYRLGIADLVGYVKKHPGDATGHYDLGMAETINDPKEALAQVNRALSIQPNFVPALYYRGLLEYQGGETQAALVDLEHANKALPNNPTILDRLGQTYMTLRRYPDAVAALGQAVEGAPQDARTTFHYARALASAGQAAKARVMMARFRELGPDPSRRRGGLVDFLSLSPQEQNAQFRQRVEKAAQEQKDNVAAQVEYLQLLLADAKSEQAVACANGILALNPPGATLADVGHILLEAEQFGLAKQFLDKAAETGTPSADLLLDRAIATSRAVNVQAGLTLLSQAPEAAKNGDYYLAQAQMLDASGQFEAAVNALNQALRAAPKRPELYRQAALFLVKHNRMREATALLEQGARLLPNVPEILLLEATLLELEKKTDDAEALLKKVEDRWPEWPDSWLVDGILLETYKRYDEARQMVETAVSLGARGPEAYFYLAESTMYSSPDQLPAAQKAIEQAEALAPQDPWVHAIAGRIALDRKEYAKAAEELQRATELRPHFAQAHYNLAQAFKAMGQTAKAETELQTVEKIHREFPNAEADSADFTNSLFQVGSSVNR